MSSTEKCSYFDKGFCKLKEQCLKKHPTSDCQGQCYDKKMCPSRHRVACKNKEKCIFLSSQACEFLHNENALESTESITTVQDSISDINGFVKGIEEKLNILDTVIKQTQNRISVMEKEVEWNSLIENRVKQLEKDNMELKTKLSTTERTICDKFEMRLSKISVWR